MTARDTWPGFLPAAKAREVFTGAVEDILAPVRGEITGTDIERIAAAADEYAAVMVDLCARPAVVVVDGRVRLEDAS
jgi:hypothetical protein